MCKRRHIFNSGEQRSVDQNRKARIMARPRSQPLHATTTLSESVAHWMRKRAAGSALALCGEKQSKVTKFGLLGYMDTSSLGVVCTSKYLSTQSFPPLIRRVLEIRSGMGVV